MPKYVMHCGGCSADYPFRIDQIQPTAESDAAACANAGVDPDTMVRVTCPHCSAPTLVARDRLFLKIWKYRCPELNGLVVELIRIGRSDGFLSQRTGGLFNDKGRHSRAHAIGVLLNENSGNDLMLAAFAWVKVALGPVSARELEVCWGYIGEWLP